MKQAVTQKHITASPAAISGEPAAGSLSP